MKLVIAGATGTLGSALVAKALQSSRITSVIALSRRPLAAPKGSESKLITVNIDDFENYSTDARARLRDVDACIWSLAVTPRDQKGQDPLLVRKICLDYTLAGLDVLLSERPQARAPLRFMYISGAVVQRDVDKLPSWIPDDLKDYMIMRCGVENELVARAKAEPDRLEICCARPGVIAKEDKDPEHPVYKAWIGLQDLAGIILQQTIDGFDKDPLLHEDLIRLGGETVCGCA